MSASDALTKLITRKLLASLTLSSAPSRALMVRSSPSTLVISPRMRATVCSANGDVFTSSTASPAAASVRAILVVMTWCMHSSRVARQSRRAWRTVNTAAPPLFPRLDQVGLYKGTQLRRDFGRLAKPQRKSAHRLVQQHAEPVGDAQLPPLGGSQKRGFERHINDIGDDGAIGQRLQIDFEWLLA